MSPPNVLNAGNRWHAYICVTNHDLSFVHAFFNNHVTVPQKKTTEKLVDNFSFVGQFSLFYVKNNHHAFQF